MITYLSRALGNVLAAGLVVTAIAGACAEPKGSIMLAINTDMRAPKDVNAVSVSISTNGTLKHSFIGRVTPQGEVLLPATLAITEPDDKNASIRIRVMAFQDRRPRVLRDIRTTVPTGGRSALLRIPLSFANDASAVGEPLPAGVLPDPLPGAGGNPSGGPGGGAAGFDFFGAFKPPCDDIQNQTVIDGECRDNFVDPETLPDLTAVEQQVGSGVVEGSCFDLAKCFATSEPVGDSPGPGAEPPRATLDRSTCSVHAGVVDPARLNLAIVTPDTGECIRPGECYVPIDRGAAGWNHDKGRIQLPRFVCALLEKKKLHLATSTDLCASKLEANPICTPKAGEVLPSSDAGADAPVNASDCIPGEFVTATPRGAGAPPCAPCERDTFSGAVNAPACEPWATCAPGTRVGKPGTPTTNRECAACASETFSATPNAADCAAWLMCTPGSFVSAAGSRTASRACSPCAAGLTTTTNNALACAAPTVVELVVGAYHVCGRFNDGSVRCWGANFRAQIGDGTKTERHTPASLPGLATVADICAGDMHGCAARGDGSVRCWGDNREGEVGDGSLLERASPTVVPGLAGVVEIAAAGQHTCARLNDGTVRCWGYNQYGQLGDGTTVGKTAPTTVPGLAAVTKLALGYNHSCALLNDGTARCWGWNANGQLGDGSTADQYSPQIVPGLAGVAQIVAGYSHTCARLNDGTARCWGGNGSGQLGDGSTTQRLGPVLVPGLAGVTNLGTGYSHVCARLNDGTVWCWGTNAFGELGDGSNTQQSSPTNIPGLAGVLDLGLGGGQSCARLNDGSVRCWGNNQNGQLGDGTLTHRSSPVVVAF